MATLKKILDAFPVSLSDFLATGAAHAEQIFFGAEELVEIAGGLLSYRQIGRNLKGKAIQILHEHMKPGADTGLGTFRHDAEEGGVVLRGCVEITVGSETRVLGPGDAYYFASRIPHRFRTVGDEVCAGGDHVTTRRPHEGAGAARARRRAGHLERVPSLRREREGCGRPGHRPKHVPRSGQRHRRVERRPLPGGGRRRDSDAGWNADPLVLHGRDVRGVHRSGGELASMAPGNCAKKPSW